MTLSNLHMSKVRMLRRTGEILKGVAEVLQGRKYNTFICKI